MVLPRMVLFSQCATGTPVVLMEVDLQGKCIQNMNIPLLSLNTPFCASLIAL